jgi:hypothetical protein
MMPQPLPEAIAVHFTGSRLRIKVPTQKGNTTYFKTLAETLQDIDGVSSVSVNTTTGSVLMLHNIDLKLLIDRINEKGCLKVRMDNRFKGKLHRQIESFFVSADKKISGATGGELNLPTVLFFALVGAGIYQVARGHTNAIPWYTALWYAYSLFKKGKDTNNSTGV